MECEMVLEVKKNYGGGRLLIQNEATTDIELKKLICLLLPTMQRQYQPSEDVYAIFTIETT
jgi:hypothetical protein